MAQLKTKSYLVGGKMKKYIYLLVLAFLTFFMGWYGIENINLEAFNEEVDVVVDSVFDDLNTILGEPVGLPLGSKTTVNAPGDASGLEFAYWIVNGVVRKDLPLNNQFTVTSNMHLLAVFHPANENVVLFIDSNGQLIGEPHYVADGGSVIAPTVLPDKPGLVVDSVETWVEASGQGVNFSNVTANAVYVLQYVSDTASTFNVSVTNGTGSGVYDYNSLVTVTTDADNGGLVFSHWEEAGKVVSRNRVYEFTALYDRSLTAIFKEVKDSDLPLVFMSADLAVRSGYETYVGQAYLPSGYELIEVGYLISQEAEILIRETAGVKVVQNNNPQASTLEFVTSFPIDSFQAIRAYMIVKNVLGDLEVVYGSQNFEGVVYETGFEASEGFTASTTYNNTTIKYTGPVGQQWGTYYGTPSTTDAISGIQTMQMRYYASAPLNLGYTFTDFDLQNVKFITFLSESSSNNNVDVSISIDQGSTWIASQVYTLTSSTTTYTYNVPIEYQDNTLRVRFTLVLSVPAVDKSQLYVDDVKIYSQISTDETNVYTVSYNTNGGSSVNSEAVLDGNLATQPTNPTKNGYTFEGWYTDEALTTAYNFATPVTSNITLYAKYTPASYTITYNLDGGENSLVNPTSYTIEDSAIILEPATRTGYAFLGWYNSVGQLVTSIASGSYGNITLYAHWELTASVTYTVNFYRIVGDATPISSVEVPENTPVLAPEEPTRVDYTFAGWYSDSSLTIPYDFNNNVTQNLNLYAKWFVEPTVYTENFDNLVNTGTTSSYLNRSWTTTYQDNSQISWTSVGIRTDNQGLTPIAPTFGANTTFNIKAVLISGGITELSLKAKNTFTGDATRNIAVYINNTFIKTLGVTSTSSTGELFLITQQDILNAIPAGVTGDFSLEIRNTGGQRVTVDDISWQSYTTGSTGGGDPETDTTAPVITVTDSKRNYLIGETVNLGCTAVDNVDGNVTCNTSGTVDTSTVGDYVVTYSATDSSSNTATLDVTYTVRDSVDYLTMDLMDYYNSAEGLSGTNLEAALRTIVNTGFNGVTYGDASVMLDDTDADPNIPGNLILMYLGTSVSGVWDSGVTWNREHVWPQSLLGVSASNGTVNIASDLHNLKPANPSVNSSRGNKYFDNTTTTLSYAPTRLEVRGDIARILFYMVIMYSHLELIDGVPSTYEMAMLGTLLQWHYDDPVDDFERNRNEEIFSFQNNRNPFIDYEHFAELIFGSHSYYS